MRYLNPQVSRPVVKKLGGFQGERGRIGVPFPAYMLVCGPKFAGEQRPCRQAAYVLRGIVLLRGPH